ncbi:MAG: ATP-binding cassette, subfamily bacterial MsbA [Phycisphaerales bacterium]|jgi:ABC-type multidrug transport system fused ATPase/permease subunit|nr:ATP-binding cassette, subfamily bacterial MsbA [Phycisphaerales bacterium]
MTESATAESTPPQAASRKKKDAREFFRACRFLLPYRRMVITSVLAAMFVAAVTTVGLSAMLPVLRVLLNDDTLQGWVDRQVVEKRLGVRLSDEPGHEEILRTNPDSLAARAGLKRGDPIQPVEKFADPAASEAMVQRPGGPVTIALPPVPGHFKFGRDVIYRLPRHPVKAIAVVFGFITALTIVSNIARFFQEYLSDKSAISAVMDIRRHLYDAVLHMPMSFFGTRGTSDVTSRLVNDSQVLQDGFKIILGQSVQEPIKAAFALGLSLFISWKLTLFIVVFAPIMFWVIKTFGKKMRRATRAALQRSAMMLGQIEGTLVGIRVVKAAGSERFERRRYRSILAELRTEMLKMARYEAYATPTMETISMLVVGVVVLYAAYLVLVRRDGSLDNAGFFTVMAALAMIGESLRRVSKVNNVLQRSNAAASRIFEILDLPMERRRLRGAEKRTTPRIKLAPLKREITFENVTFSYPNTQQPAVENVSLTVPRGQSVAIVGRNGSGKTTLLALLPRFFDPQFGRVLIDGVDVRDATLRSLRGQIGLVTQDSVIFPGTIADNIAYGMPRASRASIEEAAKRAFCHEFILQKPQGYDTPLDGLGGQLSGGQKQRINIARAILRQSPILILDEATSQVDAESEQKIQQAVELLMHERTTFVIAHRFSTILSADTIVVMEGGRIVGQGKHDDLLRTSEIYKTLFDRQLFAA